MYAIMFTSVLFSMIWTSANRQPPLTADEVYSVLSSPEPDVEIWKRIVDEGKDLYPTYRILLRNKMEHALVISRIFEVLYLVKDDKSEFVSIAMNKLCDSKSIVRRTSVRLLSNIGKIDTMSPIVAVLSDEDADVALQAADTLSMIGGKNELLAFDIWLNNNAQRKVSKQLQDKMRLSRDQMEKRIYSTKLLHNVLCNQLASPFDYTSF